MKLIRSFDRWVSRNTLLAYWLFWCAVLALILSAASGHQHQPTHQASAGRTS